MARIESCEDEKPDGKDRRLHVIAKIVKESNGKKPKANYSQLHDYVNLESEAAAWKLRELLEAVGIVKGSAKSEKGTFDPEKDIVGQEVQIRVTADSYNGEYKGRLGRYLAMPEDEDADDDDDDPDDSDDDDDDDDSDDEDDEDAPDYSEMNLTELKEEAEGRDGIDLKKVVGTGAKRKKGNALKKALIAALEKDDEENGGDDEDDEDYNDWSVADLKAELKEREIAWPGNKVKAVKALEEDDASDPF